MLRNVSSEHSFQALEIQALPQVVRSGGWWERGVRALWTKPSPHSCSVFLLDQNELVAKVFDGGVVEDEVRQGCSSECVAMVPGSGCPQGGLGSRQDSRWSALCPATHFSLPTHACPAELRDPHPSRPGHRGPRGDHGPDPEHS